LIIDHCAAASIEIAMLVEPPPPGLTFDDLRPGDRFSLGTYAISREEIIEFASKYDPQLHHLDDEAAAANPIFGRLSASGWHTAAVTNLLMDRFLKTTRLVGISGTGVDEIRWLKPAYAGDVLKGEMEIMEARPSSSRPERALIKMRTILHNQYGVPVSSLTIGGIFARAPRPQS
jgi:acyl dehydratase